MIARLVQRYQNMGIQMVLSLSFTAVAVVGMVFMGMSLFLRFSSASYQLMEENSQRILAQVNFHMDSYLRQMMRVSNTMYYRVIKNTDLAQYGLDGGMELLYDENRDAIVSIAVFDGKGKVVSATPLFHLKDGARPTQQEWFQRAMDNMENLHFSTPHVQNLFQDPEHRYRWVVSLSRQVQLTRNGVTEQGVLLVDMSFRGIEQICRDVALSNGGYLYLMDRTGELIYHPRQQLIYGGLLKENHAKAVNYSDGSHREIFQGEERQVTVKTVGYTGWKLVGVVPMENIQAGSQSIILFGCSLLLFSIFLLAFLNFRVSAHISDPIQRLEYAIKELEAGGERVDLEEEGGCYEVRQLSRSIRSMVSTMHHLMEDIVVQEEQKRRLELEVLQSQINPHFLYNTLDSVVWMTEAGHYEESIQMVTSLARLFRIALSRGDRMIQLKDELEHARHYMNIQGIRYKNRFQTQIQVEASVEGLYTPKLLVQPILENAIYHGVSAAEDDGWIVVRAYLEGEGLRIDVMDNGLGMRPEVVRQLLSEHRPAVKTSGSGMGLRNVHQRIQLLFGKAYGLSIQSEPDEGTLVCMRLPKLDQEAAKAYEREGQRDGKKS